MALVFPFGFPNPPKRDEARALWELTRPRHGTSNPFGHGSNPMGSRFGIGAPPLAVYSGDWIGCSLGVRFGF